MTEELYKNGGLIVNKREDGDISIENEDTENKVFLSKSELEEIHKRASNQ